MAKRKNVSMIGGLFAAAVLGLVIAIAMYNRHPAPPPPPEVDVVLGDAYDDSWGKLTTADSKATVTHILVAWAGSGVGTMKDPSRTPEAAKTLIDEIWAKYKNEPTEANWKALQAMYNEDTVPHNTYEIPGNLVPEFQEVGKTTKVGFARIAKSNYGYHLIRRER